MSDLGNFFVRDLRVVSLKVAEVQLRKKKRDTRKSRTFRPQKFKVYFHSYYFHKLSIQKGEIVSVRSFRGKTLLAFALPLSRWDNNREIVRMDALTRKNLGTELGNYVEIEKVSPPEATFVEIRPVGIQIRPTERFLSSLRKHFENFPLSAGNTVHVDLGICRKIPLQILNVQPARTCLLGKNTRIKIVAPTFETPE
ncbi:MAG: hypothetical protein ACTSU5_19895 [Promethearchaeota archaeon]